MSLAYNPPERVVANNMCNAIFKFKDVYKTQNEAHQPYKEIEQSSYLFVIYIFWWKSLHMYM